MATLIRNYHRIISFDLSLLTAYLITKGYKLSQSVYVHYGKKSYHSMKYVDILTKETNRTFLIVLRLEWSI